MKSTLESAGISQPIMTIPNFVPEPEKPSESVFPFPYFLFLGQLLPHKGLLNLVEAFSQVQNEIDANLLIAGNGPLADELTKLIFQKGWQDRIQLLGKINDRRMISSLYTNALALVVPSIWPENAPLVALEALACGTPIITSNKGGLPEIAGKFDPGLIFTNMDELKKLLLHASRGLRDTSNKPRKVYEEFFTTPIFVERYLAALRQ